MEFLMKYQDKMANEIKRNATNHQCYGFCRQFTKLNTNIWTKYWKKYEKPNRTVVNLNQRRIIYQYVTCTDKIIHHTILCELIYA